MDPETAVEHFPSDANIDIIYSNFTSMNQKPQDVSPAPVAMPAPPPLVSTLSPYVSLDLDTIPLHDPRDDITLQSEPSTLLEHQSENGTFLELPDPVDVYMTRILPPNLARRLSASSSSGNSSPSRLSRTASSVAHPAGQMRPLNV